MFSLKGGRVMRGTLLSGVLFGVAVLCLFLSFVSSWWLVPGFVLCILGLVTA